jgi:hypothetical protein
MNNFDPAVERTIDRLVAEVTPDAGPGMTPLARELFDEITATPPGRRRRLILPRPRWRVAVPVVAALAAGAVVLGWAFPTVDGIGPAPASAALEIERQGDFYIITVKDLFADPDVYQAELKARGLDITLQLQPTSANMAGSMYVINDSDRLRKGESVSGEGPVKAVDAPGPCERFAGCPIQLKVPVDYKRTAEVMLGREARPGEKYTLPPGIAMPGEPFHCVDYVNKKVADIVPMLRERGVQAQFTSYTKGAQVPDDWYVLDGVMSEAGKALMLAAPKPSPDAKPPKASCS